MVNSTGFSYPYSYKIQFTCSIISKTSNEPSLFASHCDQLNERQNAIKKIFSVFAPIFKIIFEFLFII